MAHGSSESFKISQKAKLDPIGKVAKKLGIKDKHLELHGPYKAKLDPSLSKGARFKQKGKYIVVSSLTPTPLGEGKTTTTIGLSMALNSLGKKSVCCISEPVLGPIFGAKGGASGGGHSQVVPYEEMNFNLSGDQSAVCAAHNLCAAYLDNTIYRGNSLDIDLSKVLWTRVTDMPDRVLRNISIGMGTKSDGVTRRSAFDCVGSSEVMAILSMSESIEDLRKKLGKMVVAFTKKMKPVTAGDLKVAGAMTVLLRQAIKPNIVQTIERTPCFIHTSSFANMGHGGGSILADKIALQLSDYVVSESGFGADLGAEKFFNIKCREGGLKPDACVLVCSIRALKIHSGDFEAKMGRPLENLIYRENISAVERGFSNLDKQIENIRCYGVPVIVCINRFQHDSEKELMALKKCALASGADVCVTSEAWSKGSQGAEGLAKEVMTVMKNKKSAFRFLYPLDMKLKDKITRIAKTMYGAKEVVFSDVLDEKIKIYRKLKLTNMAVCMAKTQFSLSHDPKRHGRPRNFKLQVKDITPYAGAGYMYVTCGDMKTIPGLPAHPAGIRMDIDKHGNIVGMI